ncbi:MAG: hypothetical protein KDK62_03500 [Chlamydiia bacterium]|nr:hypothetical protein [Chlamydiia bacterium]
MEQKEIEPMVRAALGPFFPWILLGLTLVFAILGWLLGTPFWKAYLSSGAFFMGGVQGVWAAFAHLLNPEKTARGIGWEKSPFQTEMGFTNLAIGITGLLSFFYPSWSVAVALIVAILFAGCAFVHIKDLIENKNTAPFNAGPMLLSTIITALTLFIALFSNLS